MKFERIDNGFKCGYDYLCENGKLIERGGSGDCYKYYVDGGGFMLLREAKKYCETGAIQETRKLMKKSELKEMLKNLPDLEDGETYSDWFRCYWEALKEDGEVEKHGSTEYVKY